MWLRSESASALSTGPKTYTIDSLKGIPKDNYTLGKDLHALGLATAEVTSHLHSTAEKRHMGVVSRMEKANNELMNLVHHSEAEINDLSSRGGRLLRGIRQPADGDRQDGSIRANRRSGARASTRGILGWVTMVQNTKWTEIQRFIRFTRTSIFRKKQKPLDSIVATRERLRKHQSKQNTTNMSPSEKVAWSTMEAKIAILSALIHRFNLATRKHDASADFISKNMPVETREVVEEIFTEALDRIASCIKREQDFERCMADYKKRVHRPTMEPLFSLHSYDGLYKL